MLILVVGLLVLLCVSTVQVAWNYHAGISPLDLPRTMQKYVEHSTLYDLKQAGADVVTGLAGVLNLLIIVAYPLTYILSILGYYLYKLYNTVKGAFSKYF